MDIVSYSVLSMENQRETILQLQEIVRKLPEFQDAQTRNQLISLPTGDGMALAFFGDPSYPLRSAQQISSALRGNSQLPLRMGIHTGPVYRVADINANRNVAGGGINFAQRVMDRGDAGHILISKAAADMLVQLNISWKSALHDLGEVEVKHGEKIHILNVFTKDYGNPQTPTRIRIGRQSAPSTEPNLGRLVAKLCNRRAQEDDFYHTFLDALEQHCGCPQIYLVPGDEGQCHESLVERLIYRVGLSTPLRDDSAAGRVKKLPWQYDGELQQRRMRLIYSLFESFGPRSSWKQFKQKDLSPQAFSDLLQQSSNSWITIQHDLHASRWDSLTTALVENYVTFWSEMPRCSERPPLLVFINVVFPHTGNRGWKNFRPGTVVATLRKKRIWTQLEALELKANAPCRVLAELPAVTREDVLEWFSLNHIYDSEEKRLRAVDRLFPRGSSSPRAMGEIETFCVEELRRFAEEKGYSGFGRKTELAVATD